MHAKSESHQIFSYGVNKFEKELTLNDDDHSNYENGK